MKKVFFNSCSWDKPSLFKYLKTHINGGYKIVYHQNNIVGINVTKMEVMNLLTLGVIKKLCYGTIPEIWDYYIDSGKSNAKYFLFFNFNVPHTSSKSVFSILSREYDDDMCYLDAVDKYHNTRHEEQGTVLSYSEISDKLNCNKDALFNAINRGLNPEIAKPHVKLTFGECLQLEKKILKI
jgi:hypothetical protein